MYIKPETIVFETTEDVMDYFIKGLPPSTSDAKSVFEAMENPNGVIEINEDVYIPNELIDRWDNGKDAFIDTMRYVHETNKTKFFKIAAISGIAGAVTATLFIGKK